MLFMVVEKFRNQDGKAVYRKLRSGRGLPDGLKFAASDVAADLGCCFQELVEFEVVPVVEGKTTCATLEPMARMARL